MDDATADTGDTPEMSTASVSPRDHQHPANVGRYRILEPLGEGGFGVVYRAEQTEPVRRHVALKIIKLGMDSKAVVSRFEAERQALAMMDHPCIAKVYDGGTTEQGRPYFAMELVKGEPITAHCDRQRLSVRERIELFQRVCDAVQHAHHKGVVHRDLKPSNVLVEYADGAVTPKVIDFGVAKALHQRLTEATVFTAQGQMIGTPEYMSPEQAEMTGTDIDTRSDVYSLGVLLYELLTGCKPFDAAHLREAAFAEIQRIIREVDPPKPSTQLGTSDDADSIAISRTTEMRSLTGILRRDLDWICMKCLEKNRERRYETANALADDLGRFLLNQPVSAGPPSVSYRLRKFVRRNRVGVVTGSLVAVAMLAGLAGTTLSLLEANRQRVAADLAKAVEIERSIQLEAVVQFQSEQLRAIDSKATGAAIHRLLAEAVSDQQRPALEQAVHQVDFTDVAKSLLEQTLFVPAIRAIDQRFSSDPAVRARLLQSLATTLRTVGLYELATEPQQRALMLRNSLLGTDHPDTIASLTQSGRLSAAQGDHTTAAGHHRSALDASRRAIGKMRSDTVFRAYELLETFTDAGMIDEARELSPVVYDTAMFVITNEGPYLGTYIPSVAKALVVIDEVDRAESLFQALIEQRMGTFGASHSWTVGVQRDYAEFLRSEGRKEEAIRVLLSALPAIESELDQGNLEAAVQAVELAKLLHDFDRTNEARLLFERIIDLRTERLGSTHPWTLGVAGDLTSLLTDIRQYDVAESLLLDVIANTSDGLESQEGIRRWLQGLAVHLYNEWHEADPTAGHDSRSAEWQSLLDGPAAATDID